MKKLKERKIVMPLCVLILYFLVMIAALIGRFNEENDFFLLFLGSVGLISFIFGFVSYFSLGFAIKEVFVEKKVKGLLLNLCINVFCIIVHVLIIKFYFIDVFLKL